MSLNGNLNWPKQKMEKNDHHSFEDVLNKQGVRRYSRVTPKGAVFAELFDKIFRDILKGVVFEKGGANWIGCSGKLKRSTAKSHNSIKLTPKEVSQKNDIKMLKKT